jgi:tRNA modification GTPase
LLKEVSKLRSSFSLGNVLKNGVATVIAGRPNAGKSTLMNALLNEDRAIVSDIAGTTRDTIEEPISIKGVLFRLIDTAGIRDANDAIEKIGVERTMDKIKSSALVVYLFDVSTLTPVEVASDLNALHTEGSRLISVANKTDRWEGNRDSYPEGTVFISAKDKQDLHKLEEVLYRTVVDSEQAFDQTIVSNARHVAALDKTAHALTDVLKGLDAQVSGELLALDIRNALEYLGEITGVVTHEDLLDFIFSKFCIGK